MKPLSESVSFVTLIPESTASTLTEASLILMEFLALIPLLTAITLIVPETNFKFFWHPIPP